MLNSRPAPSGNLVCLLDANARVGSITTAAIGSFGREKENGTGECFRRFTADADVYLPSTLMPSRGNQYTTWGCTAKDGTRRAHRIDYVAISPRLLQGVRDQGVNRDIELAVSHEDHELVDATIVMAPDSEAMGPSWQNMAIDKTKMDIPECCDYFEQLLHQLPTAAADTHTRTQMTMPRRWTWR